MPTVTADTRPHFPFNTLEVASDLATSLTNRLYHTGHCDGTAPSHDPDLQHARFSRSTSRQWLGTSTSRHQHPRACVWCCSLVRHSNQWFLQSLALTQNACDRSMPYSSRLELLSATKARHRSKFLRAAASEATLARSCLKGRGVSEWEKEWGRGRGERSFDDTLPQMTAL